MRMVRPAEAARKLGISESTLQRLEKRDESFPARRRITARAVAFVEEELDEWLSMRETVPYGDQTTDHDGGA